MENEDTLCIAYADRFKDSIIIGFSDGRSGRFSAALLHGMLSQSEELVEPAALANVDLNDVNLNDVGFNDMGAPNGLTAPPRSDDAE